MDKLVGLRDTMPETAPPPSTETVYRPSLLSKLTTLPYLPLRSARATSPLMRTRSPGTRVGAVVSIVGAVVSLEAAVVSKVGAPPAGLTAATCWRAASCAGCAAVTGCAAAGFAAAASAVLPNLGAIPPVLPNLGASPAGPGVSPRGAPPPLVALPTVALPTVANGRPPGPGVSPRGRATVASLCALFGNPHLMMEAISQVIMCNQWQSGRSLGIHT